ncbi:hypothetical protein ABZY36_10905 [Streptomyces sp. NPDC006627]|uniref:hypothetical protein n=1 Tax=Streptomyces sp. NPDC006627 TaxID=3154679 RepID=UPI0033B00B50
MTQQSGQGAASSDPRQPAARPAHEGVVLPADGSEPLLPGTAGRHATPAEGSPWDRPWGPGTPGAPQGGPGGSWDAPQSPAMPLPAEGADTSYGGQGYAGQGYASQPGQDAYPGHGAASYGGQADASYGGRQAPGGDPAHGAHAARPGYGDASYGAQPGHGAHAGRPDHGGQAGPHRPGSHAAPPGQAEASYGGQQDHGGQQEQGGRRMPLPPLGQSGAPLPPVAAPGAPMPGAAGPDAEATQYIAPVPGGPGGADEGATQYLPPVPGIPGGADEGATQYIPPVGPGALPPEAPAADATQFLGRAQAPAPASDSEPTQYIAPVPGGPAGSGPAGHGMPPEPAKAPYGIRPGAPGDRQPPAEFDSLFRTEPEAEGPASTQQMPRFEAPAPAGGHAAAPAPTRAGGRGGRRTRTGSKVPLIAAVGIGIAVLGVGAGALLSAGGGEDDKEADGKPVSASAPADERPSPSADPAKDQAVALDKLLADSNNSRDMVIAAVRNVGKCQNLGQSAKDLRAAARQRNGLVTRLAGLKVDKLPANDHLTTSLNKAWKASAAADNHYAAWADQVAGKKGCKKGHARVTPQAGAGNRQSNAATTAKEQAAGAWNPIARKYGLTTRDKTQL